MVGYFSGFPHLLILAAVSTIAAKPPNPAPASKAPANKLDTAQIHRTYIDGDFDLAIELIEDAMKYGGPFSHEDSVFIFKHLGVMHTAKYETREKGKHYMLQLLNVEPTAKIMDMYASDMIYMIFKNIRDEFEASRPDLFPVEPKQPKQPIAENPNPKQEKRYAWVGWTAGALVVVGGAALTVHLLEEDPGNKNVYPSNE
jgi:hypothetical protein